MASSFSFRTGRRLVMGILLITYLFLYVFHQDNSPNQNMCRNTRSLATSQAALSWKEQNIEPTLPYYRNLNDLETTSEHILVLTPILEPDAIDHVERYFELLDKSTYPNHLISIGLLISLPSSSSSSTNQHIDLLKTLTTLVHRLQHRWFNQPFHNITIYQRDLHFDFNPTDKNRLDSFDFQPYRRSNMARARNYLLSAALRNHHRWVAWIDVDVMYRATIFEDLIRHNVDVIVPNCLLPTEDHSFWGYDRRNWQETDESMRFQMKVGSDFLMLEGYDELVTGRTLMVDMPTHLGPDHLVPLDGIGASFILVQATVHRQGATFTSKPFQNQVDTEGFAKMVKAMGFDIFGIPSYFVYHGHS